MMNRSEENQNGCREQIRNEDEGIDGILEALGAYVCDELCCHRGENLTQEEIRTDKHTEYSNCNGRLEKDWKNRRRVFQYTFRSPLYSSFTISLEQSWKISV